MNAFQLRRDRDVDKMPKEMLIWHKQTLKSEKGYKSRSNDRFGLNNRVGGQLITIEHDF